MKTEKLYVIAFSPTGTSRAVASAIASGTGICETEYIDLGKPGSKPEITLPENAVAVISVPVYGGMAAPVAMERRRV
jgi:4Fe-4S ferredoxin, iron-sulfur binding protein